MAEKIEFGEGYEFPKEVHNMLVSAQATHVQFSAMADSKASILMGATFVVFSLTIGQMSSNSISLPLLLLGGFSFAATVLSVLAILPSIGGFKAGAPNLLFFGVFSRMKEDEFIDTVVGAMRSEEQVYRMMARDVYQNGVVTQRHKFRYLNYAYRTFLVGLIATLIGFVAQSLFGG
ncbi:MAG TPA: Pycsar system effector family protein [Allosphingosinicella sp.]|nr:Pycsar system effector family protein [Allosphingosinicella sp.]